MIRRILYWLAVVAVAALLTYPFIQLAEGLDASQVGAALLPKYVAAARPS